MSTFPEPVDGAAVPAEPAAEHAVAARLPKPPSYVDMTYMASPNRGITARDIKHHRPTIYNTVLL